MNHNDKNKFSTSLKNFQIVKPPRTWSRKKLHTLNKFPKTMPHKNWLTTTCLPLSNEMQRLRVFNTARKSYTKTRYLPETHSQQTFANNNIPTRRTPSLTRPRKQRQQGKHTPERTSRLTVEKGFRNQPKNFAKPPRKCPYNSLDGYRLKHD